MREAIDEKRKALLLKLKDLSEKGVGGEASNAQVILSNLLRKYDISESELGSEVITRHDTHVDTNQPFDENLLHQVCYSVYGDINPEKGVFTYTYDSKSRRWKRIMIKCTDAEFIEIMAKYEHYYRHLHEDMETFYRAFITTNEIYPSRELRKPDDTPRKPMSDKEYEAARLASVMSKRDYLLRLNGKNSIED